MRQDQRNTPRCTPPRRSARRRRTRGRRRRTTRRVSRVPRDTRGQKGDGCCRRRARLAGRGIGHPRWDRGRIHWYQCLNRRIRSRARICARDPCWRRCWGRQRVAPKPGPDLCWKYPQWIQSYVSTPALTGATASTSTSRTTGTTVRYIPDGQSTDHSHYHTPPTKL